MENKSFFKSVFSAAKDAFKGFSEHKVTKLSASLAYYTVFSLGPLLVVIISLCSIFFRQEAVQGTIDNQLRSFIGQDGASQIQTIIKNAAITGKGGVAAIIGIVTLLLGATTIFGELQDSMNSIWGVKAKPKAGIMKIVTDRLISFGMLASLGFLLLVSLTATTVVEGIGDRLKAAFPDVAVIVLYIVNLALTVSVVTILFGVIFKVLPDVRLHWKDIWPGAIATGLLFLVGKFAISFYLNTSNVGSTYGSAGSIVILLLWIYYSSIIIYYGAEFTKAYAVMKGAKIKPTKLAEWENQPAIAGAKPANQTSVGPNRESERDATYRAPKMVPVASVNERGREREAMAKGDIEKDKKPGMGVLIAGLALYFITSGKDKS